MTITVYGIKTCDTCRKARRQLDADNVAYRYHDLREDGLDPQHLDQFLRHVDWQTLLNTRSTSWRQLDAADKKPLDAERARELMLANPTLIKRPVLQRSKPGTDDTLIVGFDPARYAALAS
ncbi:MULTISPECIES: ArsC family reductase [Salinicola]|uniref:ArsC family reductase n=1 Tax=Salinicola socius TaxID=404433 RepID=A0A1Q8SX19_9GAMM|nr:MULTISPECIES: ArsC family reductase [Salinicola]OLO06008.1 ArsC family reductase [Salinicola socius]